MYGKAKERDMIRSVLPSTRRKGAREDLAIIKRNARRSSRQSLHVIALDHEAWDETPEVYDYPDTEIRYAMYERRDGDKISALQRWAPSKVKGIRPLDALSKIKALLPDNTIGRHAVSHVDHLPEFCIETPNKYGPWCYNPHDNWKARNLAAHLAEIAALEERVYNLLAVPGAHRKLNALVKTSWVDTSKDPVSGYNVDVRWGHGGRPLYGHHDVSAFVKHHGRDLFDILKKVLG